MTPPTLGGDPDSTSCSASRYLRSSSAGDGVRITQRPASANRQPGATSSFRHRSDTAVARRRAASAKPDAIMRYTIVTETYPPEVNGVALTVQGLERGLRARGNEVDVVRPRQLADASNPSVNANETLVRGLPLPRYPDLRIGLPATHRLRKAWTERRPMPSTSPPKVRSAGPRCARRGGSASPPPPGSTRASTNTCATMARRSCKPRHCAGCAASITEPMPRWYRRTNCRRSCRRRASRRSCACRAPSIRHCSIRRGAMLRCVHPGAWRTTRWP